MGHQTMTLPVDVIGNTTPPPFEPVIIVLARKFVLLMLIMIVTALGLVILLRQVHLYSLVLATILSDAVIGLVAGFSTRLILRKQIGFLRVVSNFAFLIAGLELLGWFTGWRIGLGQIRIGLSILDWFSLGQLFLGSGVAFLSMVAWTKPAHVVVDPAPQRNTMKCPPRPRLQRNKPHRRPDQAGSRITPQVEKAQSVEPKRKRVAHPKPHLQLSDQQEHRCPYCLELIDPDDPQGTVECKICHTLHHADCWAITGACQVPHYTA
jgi:uncharacterized Zn-finger protein